MLAGHFHNVCERLWYPDRRAQNRKMYSRTLPKKVSYSRENITEVRETDL